MKFRTKIEKIADPDEDLRPALSCVLVDGQKKVMVASNGFALAVVPDQSIPDGEPVLIDAKSLKKARGSRRKTPAEMDLGEARKMVVPHPDASPEPLSVERFPDYEDLTEKTEEMLTKFVFVVNAELLHDLAEAVCSVDAPKFVRIIIDPNKEYVEEPAPVRVEPLASEPGKGPYGLIMPVHSLRDYD